jgi:uncharacterized repeat protein (TIGR03803 family)
MRLRLPLAVLLLLLPWLASPGVIEAAPIFQSVAQFAQPPRTPLTRMLYVPADGHYYGTTTRGGAHGRGAIFRMSPAGQLTTLVSFTGESGQTKGEAPDTGLVLGADGALYGATLAGGALGFGTLFKVTTGGVFTTLVEFSGTTGQARGSVPGDLVIASDGYLYGTTQAGGANDLGTIFRYGPLGLFTTLAEFTGTSGARPGATPLGGLVASGSVLYGVTQSGGNHDLGTVFKIQLAGTGFSTLYHFNTTPSNPRGIRPAAGLCLHSDGALYGTTEEGGANDAGTIFRITTGGSFVTLHHFTDSDGAQPTGTLLVGPDSALYGTASGGGKNGYGTIFRLAAGSAPNAPTVLAEFTGVGGAVRGAGPRAGLSYFAPGVFLGTTSAGGAGDEGTVFTISTAGVFMPLAEFTDPSGWEPAGGVAFDADGSLLVPMRHGGLFGEGTLLRVSAGGTVGLETAFGGTLGDEPAGGLLRVGADFFGLAESGGSNGRGVFFRHSPGLATTPLSHCTLSGGAKPEGPLIRGADGNFYGVAREGGAEGKGAILRFTPSGVRTRLVSFTGMGGVARGARPRAPLALGLDGNFYGVTERGGTSDLGTIFMVTPAGVLTTLHDFAAKPAPNLPQGGLTLGPDGNFYGTASAGGASDKGAIFRCSSGGLLTVLVELTGNAGSAPGSQPAGFILAALDGTLYGTASQAGANGGGTVFKITPGGTYSLLQALSGTGGVAPGAEPRGELAFGPDGLLYSTAQSGGPQGGGTIFRLSGLGPHAGTDPVQFAPGLVTLSGRAQTGGEPVAVSFEYGLTPALGSTVPGTITGATPALTAFSATLANLAPGAAFFYRARATGASGSSGGLVRSFTVPASPLEAWKLGTFGSASVADLGDADGDGVVNLVEYALLMNPLLPDLIVQPNPQTITYAEGRRLAVTLQRDPARSDITIIVQAADDPAGPWTALATSTLGAPFSGPGYVGGDAVTPGIKTVEIRDIVNVAAAPRRLMRLKITH